MGAAFLAAVFFAATFFPAGFLATVFLAAVFLAETLTFFAVGRFEAVLLAATFFAAFFAAATFFVFFFALGALLAFFAFFAMIVLPIVAADFPTHRGAIKHDLPNTICLDSRLEHDFLRSHLLDHALTVPTRLESPIASDHLVRSNALGADPPVAQSISSIG